MTRVLWAVAVAWILCVGYWLTLADCLEATPCSDAHLWLNEATFFAILVLPAAFLIVGAAELVRRVRADAARRRSGR
jgi:hypothetical protein